MLVCGGGQIFNSMTGKCVCPNDIPYWNGQQCVACSGNWSPNLMKCFICDQNMHWNQTVQACVACQVGYDYDAATDKCIAKVAACAGGQQYNPASGVCECFSNKPYWNNIQCVSCPQGAYWSNKNLQCLTCQGKEHWDSDLQLCSSCPPQFEYSFVTKVCVPAPPTCSGGQLLDSANGKCVCPASLPYWDGQKCLNCDAPSRWVTSQMKCVVCTSSQYWDNSLQVCSSCPANTT